MGRENFDFLFCRNSKVGKYVPRCRPRHSVSEQRLTVPTVGWPAGRGDPEVSPVAVSAWNCPCTSPRASTQPSRFLLELSGDGKTGKIGDSRIFQRLISSTCLLFPSWKAGEPDPHIAGHQRPTGEPPHDRGPGCEARGPAPCKPAVRACRATHPSSLPHYQGPVGPLNTPLDHPHTPSCCTVSLNTPSN